VWLGWLCPVTSMQWGDGWRRPGTDWSGQSQVIVNRDTGTGQCLKNTYDTLRYHVWGDKHPFTIYLSTTVFYCANSANPGISFFKNVFYSHVHMDGGFFRQALTTSSSSLQELLNDVSHWAVKILRARYGACYGARYGAHGVWAGNWGNLKN